MSYRFTSLVVAFLVAPVLLGTLPVHAAPDDYATKVVQAGKSNVRVRLVNLKKGTSEPDSEIVESSAVIGPRGQAASMTIQMRPVKDPNSDDQIFKIEPGMVVRELNLKTKVKAEVELIRDTIKVRGDERDDEPNGNKNP